MNTGWMGFVWVGLGGAFGSMVRYGVGRLVGWWIPGASSMLGTGLVNLVGSFLLGVVVSVCTVGGKPNGWGLLLGVGFCGGLTTFSTLAMELADLMHAKRHWEMLGLGLGSLILGIAAFAAGLWLASKALAA